MIQKALQFIGTFFNYNYSWFILLALLSIALLVFVFLKKRDSKLVALYFFSGSAASCLENVIFVWIPSYEYYPHILKNNYYDMTLGAYLSQQFNVTSVTVLIAAFNLGYGWILCLAALFVGIEILFLKLGIYKLIWWNPLLTFIGLLIYFWGTKKWNGFLIKGASPTIRFITVFGISYILHLHLIMIPLLSDHYHFAVHWFDKPTERNSLTVMILYWYAKGLITTIVSFYRFHWALQSVVPIVLTGSYFLLMHLHFLTYKYIWDLFILMGADIVVLFCCNYFNRILSKNQLT